MRWTTSTLLLLILTAGCLDENADTDPEPEPLEAAAMDPADLGFGHDATGCDLAAAVVPRPMADLAPFLPDGFSPGDAGGLLGTPVPVGLGAAVFSAYHCDGGEATGGAFFGAEINIVVEDPGIGEGNDTAISTHYYPVFWGTDNGPLHKAVARLGWTVANATADPFFVDVPTPSFDFVYSDDAYVFALMIDAQAPQTLSGTSRFWQVVDGGTAWVDYTMDTTVNAGGYILETGSDEARAIHGHPLAPQFSAIGQAPGLRAIGFDWEAEAGFLPDA